MDPDADLASVAALMADKHRAQMLLTLLGGTPMSGSALAEAAGISRSLARAPLKRVVAGGLVRGPPHPAGPPASFPAPGGPGSRRIGGPHLARARHQGPLARRREPGQEPALG